MTKSIKYSISNKKRWKNPEYRIKQTAIIKKTWDDNRNKGFTDKQHTTKIKLQISNSLNGHIESEETRKRISENKKHSLIIKEETKQWKKLGYYVLNGDLKPRADLLVSKEPIIAVEIETKPEKYWNKKKYDGVDFFKEVIWKDYSHDKKSDTTGKTRE